MEAMRRDIHEIRSSINEYTEIKIDMGNSALAGKATCGGKTCYFQVCWSEYYVEATSLDLSIFSGERIRLQEITDVVKALCSNL